MNKRTISFLLILSMWTIHATADVIFKNGLERHYLLTYSASSNGTITGNTQQLIEQGLDGTPVTAIADAGYLFVDWSDAITNSSRVDTNIQTNITVTANFTANTFGQAGSHSVATPYQEPTELATIYYPSDASASNKVPVIFFAPSWGSTNSNHYELIFNFIASHGYAVIFANDEMKFTSNDMLVDFISMVNDTNINFLLDTSKIGVMGHSIGGGHTFNILDKLSDIQGWGTKARFLFAIEPWFAFDMMQIDMRTLPSNTNVVIQQYGAGGFNSQNATDMRIPLTEYYLLESIADTKKDYQVHANADHYYPYGAGTNYNTKQIILAPLDALMEYTFANPTNIVARNAALELGNDNPYANGNGIQEVFPRGDASITNPCNGYNFTNEDIDFCDIQGYPYSSKFTSIPTNNATVQPILLGTSTDVEFGTTITRLTNRAMQNDISRGTWRGGLRGNHHPYPKTQAWNADMTMLRMRYRIYDANTLQEIPLTTPKWRGEYPLTTQTWDLADLYYINGALNEIKWSTQDPNVFYGVFLTWDKKGEYWQGKIDRATNTISYLGGLIHSFGTANTYEKFTIGNHEGNLSFDDRYVVFAARKIAQNHLTAIVYDKQNDTFTEKDFDGNSGNAFVEWNDSIQVFDWMSVSPLGNYVLISTGDTIQQYDMNLDFVRELSTNGEHGDMGLAQNGDEVYVQYEFGTDRGVWAYRLNDGYRHQLLPDKYNGGHISCRNYQRPGWCYLSASKETHREVFALRINFADQTKHVVNRFAQTHALSMTSLGGVSPDGKRVIFFTNWEDTSLNYNDRDTYQSQKLD